MLWPQSLQGLTAQALQLQSKNKPTQLPASPPPPHTHACPFTSTPSLKQPHTQPSLSALTLTVSALPSTSAFTPAHPQDLSWYKLFAAGYAIAHGAQLLVLSSLFILRPRARRYAALESISRVAAVVLAVAIVGAGPPDLPTAPPLFYILLGCIALVDVLAPALPYLTTSAQLPVHVEHLSERMGLFTILYLGEPPPRPCWCRNHAFLNVPIGLHAFVGSPSVMVGNQRLNTSPIHLLGCQPDCQCSCISHVLPWSLKVCFVDLVVPAHAAGEAIIGLVIEPIVNNLLEFLGLCLAAMVVWCLHLLYYHIHPGQEAHAFRQSKTRGLLFAYSHWLLGCAFLFTATSLRLIIATYPSFNPESERQAGAIPDAPAEAPTPLKLAAAVPPGLGAAWQQLPYPGRRMLAEGGNCAEMESRATRYHIKDGTPSHDVSALSGELLRTC